jgi:hypothetical protein
LFDAGVGRAEGDVFSVEPGSSLEFAVVAAAVAAVYCPTEAKVTNGNQNKINGNNCSSSSKCNNCNTQQQKPFEPWKCSLTKKIRRNQNLATKELHRIAARIQKEKIPCQNPDVEWH